MIRVVSYPVVDGVVIRDDPKLVVKDTSDYQYAMQKYDRELTMPEGRRLVILERNGVAYHSMMTGKD